MVCLDTTYIIDVIKGKVSIEKLDKLETGTISIAAPTIVEVIRGLHIKSTQFNIKHDEEEKIENILNSLNVLQLNKNSAKTAGKLHAKLINKGEDIGIIDIMISAICIENDETLITRNVKHFEKIPDLKIEAY
jgi:tRNA(fMet)-specific endonuclease VapC